MQPEQLYICTYGSGAASLVGIVALIAMLL